jgi:hypothetical protein
VTKGERFMAFGDKQYRTDRSVIAVVFLKHCTYRMLDLAKTVGATFAMTPKPASIEL